MGTAQFRRFTRFSLIVHRQSMHWAFERDTRHGLLCNAYHPTVDGFVRSPTAGMKNLQPL